MQVRYIRPFSQYKVGDVVEMPDGARFDPFYLELIEEAEHGAAGSGSAPAAQADPGSATPAAAAASAPRLPIPPKEM